MQTQLHVEFQGTTPSPAVREKIRRHVSDLESFFGRITSCRVVLKVPGAHHRKGIYEFNMQLMLPNGKQVNVWPKELASGTATWPSFIKLKAASN